MTTYTFNKELFLEAMENLIDDDEFVIFSTTPQGQMAAANKSFKAKKVGIAFSEDVFDKPNTISDILNSRVGGLIICKKEIISKQVKTEIENYEKTKVKKK